MISIIVATDSNLGIGQDNQLLCHLPADLSYFKKMTLGKPVVMGRKTYESIGRPLPGRKNIVISRQNTLGQENVCLVDSLDKALSFASEEVDVMIIGGATIYEQALPRAHKLYVTRIHHAFQADSFFPPIKASQWALTQANFRAKDQDNAYDMTFEVYEKAFIES